MVAAEVEYVDGGELLGQDGAESVRETSIDQGPVADEADDAVVLDAVAGQRKARM